MRTQPNLFPCGSPLRLVCARLNLHSWEKTHIKKGEPTGYGSARKERQTYGEEMGDQSAYLWISQGHSDPFLFDFKKSRSRRGEEFGSCASGLLANAFRSMPKNSLTASNTGRHIEVEPAVGVDMLPD